MYQIIVLTMLFPFLGGACMAGMAGGCGMGMGHANHAAGSEAVVPEDTRPAADSNFDAARTRRVLEAYNRILVALVDDELGGVGEAASRIVKDAPNEAIRSAAEPMAGVETEKNLAESREHFKVLSDAVARYVAGNYESLEAEAGKDKQPIPQKAFCPMAEAVWLQYGDKITNPYYGASMLRCGEFQDWLKPVQKKTTEHPH